MHHSNNAAILAPVVVLVGWTLIMLVWTLAVRLPALKKAGIDMSRVYGTRPNQLDGLLPDKTQWPVHNYMHLVEQPTLFYAIALTLAFTHAGGGWNPSLAWAYVGLRILHSLVQATINRVAIRFLLFLLSTLVLMALTVKAGIAIWWLGGW